MCIEAAEDLKELLFFSVGSISVRFQRKISELTIFDEIKSLKKKKKKKKNTQIVPCCTLR
jgi:hypothetical protein